MFLIEKINRASLVAQSVKNLLQCRRPGFNPWVCKIPWRRKWQPTPVFCLENSMDRGALQTTVHGVTKSQTWLNGQTQCWVTYIWNTGSIFFFEKLGLIWIQLVLIGDQIKIHRVCMMPWKYFSMYLVLKSLKSGCLAT